MCRLTKVVGKGGIIIHENNKKFGAAASRHGIITRYPCVLNKFLSNKFLYYWFTAKYHYFRSVCLFDCLFVCLSVCLFVCAEFFSAVFDPIWIKLRHMLHVRV